MGKKTNKSKRKIAKPVKDEKPVAPPSVEEDERFNFGGLPERDLKKNLGCG